MSVEDRKRAAGWAAAELVEPGMTVGLGTGSTAAWFVRALAERHLPIRCVATSAATARLGSELGLALIELDEAGTLDLTVDGADEIGPGLALIKGGGAALLREKLVWSASRRCVVIADDGKRVARLGRFPLSIEVVAFGHAGTASRIAAAASEAGIASAPVQRRVGGEPVTTDGGNLVYDLSCGEIADPPALAAALKAVTGVVDHGLFLGLAESAVIAGPAGISILHP
ncbi:MAG: ribose-5-phosphate isomerase RpiA [Caulobacteraceae bacterium]